MEEQQPPSWGPRAPTPRSSPMGAAMWCTRSPKSRVQNGYSPWQTRGRTKKPSPPSCGSESMSLLGWRDSVTAARPARDGRPSPMWVQRGWVVFPTPPCPSSGHSGVRQQGGGWDGRISGVRDRRPIPSLTDRLVGLQVECSGNWEHECHSLQLEFNPPSGEIVQWPRTRNIVDRGNKSI